MMTVTLKLVKIALICTLRLLQSLQTVSSRCRREQNRDGVTPEEDPTSLKKAKLESAKWAGADIGPTSARCQVPFNRDTVDLAPGATEGAGGVLSQ